VEGIYIVPIHKNGVIGIMEYHCKQLHTKFYQSNIPSRLSSYIDEIIGDHHCGV
jgi:hypothetical protein